MEQNKIRTYFLYAIGEIFLVVFGILIALQVNNWNEERKENELKSWYISAINTDINDNLNNMRLMDSLAAQDSLNLIKLRDRLINNDGNLDTLKTILKNMNTYLVAYREFTSPSLDALLNSGDIDLFDKTTREQIIRLKTVTTEYLKINDLAFGLYRDAFARYNNLFGIINPGNQLGENFEQGIWDNTSPVELVVTTKQLLFAKLNFHQVGFSIRNSYRQVAQSFQREMGPS